MTIRWPVVLYSVAVAGMVSGADAQSGAPPHAPNFCTPDVCLEVAPIPQPERRRFVKPSFSTNDRGGTKRIRISFETLGDVLVTLFASSEGPGDSVFVNGPCAEGGSCVRGAITAEGAGGMTSNESLKCQIRMLWVMRPGYRVTESSDVSQAAAYRIATKRNGSTCIGYMLPNGR
jgi:hypothetical protein